MVESRSEPGKPPKVVEYRIPDYRDVPDERCWLCGGLTHGRGMLKADRITDMFSDLFLAAWPESKSLCMACSALQSQKPFRLYSSLITEQGVRHVARATWAEVLANPPDPPWAACLAVSGQKHLFFKTQINRQNNIVCVQMEDLPVRFTPDELRDLLEVVERLYAVFTKDEILTGAYSSGRIGQYGMAEFERDSWYVGNYRGERLLALAVWIARRDEEARNERLEAAKERKAQRAEEAVAKPQAKRATGKQRSAQPKHPTVTSPEPATEPEAEAVGQLSLF